MKLHDVLHMRRMNLVTAFVLSAFVLSCSDEEWAGGQGNEIPGQDVTVKLNFQVTTPEVKATTRVPSDNVVFDLYVLIFDAAGNKTGGGFFEELDNPPATEQPGTTGSDNYVTIDTKTGASYIYGFANVSGSVNEYVDNIKDRLDAVRTRDELLNLSVTLHSSIERAGNSYLMSGTAENQSNGTYLIEKNSDIRTLQLRRLDSHITFNIKEGDNCTFTPTSYQVFNVPRKVYMVEREAVRQPGLACTWDATVEGSEDEPGTFNTREITGALAADMSFNFWMVENRRNAKQEITDTNGYNLREKEEKIDNGSVNKPTVTNGSYVYAPDEGTYVVIKGHFAGQSTVDGNEGAVEADVSYTIHLGYVDGDADDFFSNRNTKYTYNMTVNGVDNIILEVLAESPETEPSPGAEGDVIFTQGTTRYSLDAHYETVLLRFSRDLLEHGNEVADFFSYKINTPFASYISTDENISVRDEDWLRIVRNKKNSSGSRTVYSEDFQPYAVEGSYGRPSQRNGMTLSEFIEELKEIANGEITNVYDANDEVVYTCHIDEFYYDEAPQGVSVSGDLWKRFVNVSPREVQILNDVELSPDGESSITRSTYILSQRAIQTFYNTELPQSYSAYGVETVNETGPLYTWAYYNDQVGVRVTDRDTGHSNFWRMIDALMNKGWNGSSWDKYVDFPNNGYRNVERDEQTVNAMKGDYQRAYLACMQRNRDLDGDGNISQDEVKWYLPAINQYVGMFIGDGSLSEEAKLYTETDYVYKHYVSSTTNGTAPIIYWAEEYVSESSGTEYVMAEYRADDGTLKYTDCDTYQWNGNTYYEDNPDTRKYVNHYRCMRDLGDETPENYYARSGRSITVPYLDTRSTRDRLAYGELGTHLSNESNSELASGGFTYYNDFLVHGNRIWNGYQQYTVNAHIGDVMDDPYTSCRYIGDYRGQWRAPNLRELYLMSINDALDVYNVSQPNVVSRTKFRFFDQWLPNSNSLKRIGWYYNGTNLTMGNGSSEEGSRIRCVRDN